MTDTPNEQAPATRSEWLALIREAVRLEMGEQRRVDPYRPASEIFSDAHPHLLVRVTEFPLPQPPSEG